MTANEILNDVQCNITYMTDNAQGIAKALYDLSLCDDLLSTDDENSGDITRRLKVRELLRTHNTCARLVCILSDTLDGIMKELDRLDMIQIPETEPAPKNCKEFTAEQFDDLKKSIRKLRQSFGEDTTPEKGGKRNGRKA